MHHELDPKHERALGGLTPLERGTMRKLLSLAEEQGSLHIVVDPAKLAENLRCKRNVLQWHLYRLAQKEWIARETRPGKKGPKRIQINPDKLGKAG